LTLSNNDGEGVQFEIVAALESGAATGAPGPLRRIDTHLSHVFLGQERVYKLKRAVRLPFVDFSTVEQRRGACEAELELNQRFAAPLYEQVSPLTRGPDGQVRLGGEGPALDWVVVMRRFEDGALLDELACSGRLKPALVGEAAEAIARFHAECAPVPGVGGAEDYRDIVRGLRRTEADGAAANGLTPGPVGLYLALEAEIGRQAPLIEARRQAGKVRRGHGDLHLRNICLFQGRAMPFDALEFDPALATADVLYDIAFLLMDLRRRGLREHAGLAMNAYWDTAGEDESGLALLPLFMALRAAVRSAVAMQAGDPKEADAYRALGHELLAPMEPRLLAIGGLSGSGKSAVARAVAFDLPGVCGGRLLRTDVIRKTGRPLAEALGSEAYSPARRAAVYAALAGRAREALAAGASVVADATFQEAEARSAVLAAAPATALWLRASMETRLARVGVRSGDASDADAQVAAAQTEPDLEPGWTVIDAEGPLEEVVARARSALGELAGASRGR
jgi:aminoglycoside phosphotransferase family enzyme/predicted kinase